MSRARSLGLLFVGVASASVACSIAIRRDLSAIPAGQVGFDDMCGLQEYFDALEIKSSPPPRVVSALDLEAASGGKTVRGGSERFAFENDFQLKHLRRILNENWRRLPEPVASASKIEIEVKWSEKAGSKRVVTDEDAEMTVGQRNVRPAVPRLPVRAALRRAALSPAPRDVGPAVARRRRQDAPTLADGGAARDAGTRSRRRDVVRNDSANSRGPTKT